MAERDPAGAAAVGSSRSLRALALRRLDLGDFPTPVQRVDFGQGRVVWVKREDRSARPYGGNKVRKLAWLLPALMERGAPVLTAGALGSHHALACALYGGRQGLAIHAVLFPQPPSEHVRRNYAATCALAAGVRTCPAAALAPLWIAAESLRMRRRYGRMPALVPPGASTPLGTLGWVEAGLEIAEQVREGQLPEPSDVFVPLGSGGTAAGLLLGLALAGLPARVHAVAVLSPLLTRAAGVLSLARATARLLDASGGRSVRLRADRLCVHHEQVGGGYGHPTAAGRGAIELARSAAGLQLEATYTAKALAACLEYCLEPGRAERVLFVDTVSSRMPGGDPSP